MKKRLAQAIPLGITVIAAASAPVSNWCVFTTRVCYGSWVHQNYQYLIEPLGIFATISLVASIVLLIVPFRLFKSWLKFAVWALPLAIIYIWIMPVNYSGVGINLYAYYRVNAAHDAGIAFAVGSVIAILWSWWRGRGEQKTV